MQRKEHVSPKLALSLSSKSPSFFAIAVLPSSTSYIPSHYTYSSYRASPFDAFAMFTEIDIASCRHYCSHCRTYRGHAKPSIDIRSIILYQYLHDLRTFTLCEASHKFFDESEKNSSKN